ncbi:hypothetical protein PsYK624_040480 [Phanerochaete sordida]|uniref:Uncharacterized protein n=1 Tax=Phanerochaete sordida TaxID=48140 RepID=A0A9P3G508_9APHY|nr:hypothetical protein PsYK624_040480 [Phanerochaete sordida]
MRRKSSAQNLLTSFKPGSLGQASQTGTISSISGLPFATALPTPMATTPMARDWDVQSLQSDSTHASTPNGGAVAQGTSVEMLRELVKKRIITLTYLRNVHEGRSHWFHTIMITPGELDRVFSNAAMKSRTYRFACLGMSLANYFDVKEPQDLLRGLLNALMEFDQSKEDGERPKMRSLFRSGRPKRQLGATDYAISYTDSLETSYLVMPHVPFPLDYHQTLLSLLDILSEVYNKISKILGPSPFPSSGQHMTGPLGLLSPHPGVSYLFSGTDALPANDADNSLWGIANAGSAAVYAGQLGSPPPSWTSALGDAVKQIDTRLKKLIAVLLKELDDFARTGIKDELASLDPLLRNVEVLEERGEIFDLDQ